MSVSIAFTWNLLTITDVVGIILTALDFLGLTQRLEAAFGKARVYFDRYARYQWLRSKRNWPPHKHMKAISLEIIDTLPVALLCFGGYIWLSGSYPMMRDFFFSLSEGQKGLLYFGGLIAIFANTFLAQHATGRIIWLTVSGLEKLFMILGLPPKGVMGSIGLIVSVLSFTLTHIIEFGV